VVELVLHTLLDKEGKEDQYGRERESRLEVLRGFGAGK